VFKGSPAHVSALSGPATRAGIRPVIPGGRRRGRPCHRRFPVVFRPPASASWGILFPPRNSTPLTVGLPGSQRLDPDGVSTFRTSESRPDWLPSLPRGPTVLSRPVRSLRPPLAPTSRGQALSPRSSSISGAVYYEASSRVHSRSAARPSPSPGRSPGWNRGP
jgi:hypothetical protein